MRVPLSQFYHGCVVFGGILFLYFPIGYLIFFSFSESRVLGVWTGFSLKWYKQLAQNYILLQAIQTSFQIAIVVATCSIILATGVAFVLTRKPNLWGNSLLRTLMNAPLIMPEVVSGLAFLLFFVVSEKVIGIPKQRGFLTIIFTHITIISSYIYLMIQSAFLALDKDLEEAAMNLGAKHWRVFMFITLPMLSQTLLGGWLLAFALSLDDVVIASFLSGPGATTLPMLIFSSIRIGFSPEINALASFLVGTLSLLATFLGLIFYRSNTKHRKF
jgi:putrescine transport system permease protein